MDWVPEEELELLRNAPPPSTVAKSSAEKIAMQVFRDHLPLAAEVICAIAVESDSEKNRLAASKYIVERVLGRTPETSVANQETSPYEALFGSVLREPTADERTSGARVSRIK